jgi:hypothetical protein
MRKSVGQAPTVERRTKATKETCQTYSDIGAEQDNHNVGRDPTGSERVKCGTCFYVFLCHVVRGCLRNCTASLRLLGGFFQI